MNLDLRTLYEKNHSGVHAHDLHKTKNILTDTPTIAVIGLGYVGLPLALQASKSGLSVIGIDIDEHLVSEFKNGNVPEFLSEEEKNLARRSSVDVHTDPAMLDQADVVIICVPTPVTDDHQPDLRPLISACETLAPHIHEGMLIVVESTVNPGVSDEVILPILESGSLLFVEDDFYFAYCPERINPGDMAWDVSSIPRVLGGAGEKSTEHALALYTRIIDAPIHLMKNVREAEAVKIMENSFRDINIAFVNELVMSFKKLDIDIMHVLEGAATKPFGFMPHFPGCGVGGHCIPVDPYYLISYAKQNGFTHHFLETARNINNSMPTYTVDLLESNLEKKGKQMRGARVALLGLSYKRDVPDLRESPALKIEKELTQRGALIRTYDPYLLSHSSTYTLEDTLRNADAALIATDHSVFRELTAKDFAVHNVDVVIDGRNCLNKESFANTTITYHGIGR